MKREKKKTPTAKILKKHTFAKLIKHREAH